MHIGKTHYRFAAADFSIPFRAVAPKNNIVRDKIP